MIDGGNLVEAGTHEELLDKNGVYKRLVLRQLMAGNTYNTKTDEPLIDLDNSMQDVEWNYKDLVLIHTFMS